jgi:hypothetical protein
MYTSFLAACVYVSTQIRIGGHRKNVLAFSVYVSALYICIYHFWQYICKYMYIIFGSIYVDIYAFNVYVSALYICTYHFWQYICKYMYIIFGSIYVDIYAFSVYVLRAHAHA